MTYNQYYASPSGLQYLSGDILPWQDYIIFRADKDTSVSVYSTKYENGTFYNATVRTVYRSNYSNYVVSENQYDEVSVNIDHPYYAYGNIIGVSYELPSSMNIMSLAVCACVVVCSVLSIFRLVWSFKRGLL